MNKFSQAAIVILLLAGYGNAFSDTAYVTDQLRAGLHADDLAGSPIVKIIPTGTPLEVIKADDRFTFVRDPEGAEGWIDNQYLVPDKPDRIRLREAEARISELEASLTRARQDSSTARNSENSPIEQLEADRKALEQQFKSERIKTGELQVQIAELRKRLGQGGGNHDELYEKIDRLNMEKKQLEVQLARALEGNFQKDRNIDSPDSLSGDYLTPQNILIAIVVVLITGVIIGLYLMDFIHRRRHGGFRI